MRGFFSILAFAVVLWEPCIFATEEVGTVDLAGDSFSFQIEDARSFVGIAPVYLSVSELKPDNGELIGYYTIRVPMMSSKNDRGKIILLLDASISELWKNGGVISGKALSQLEDGIVNQVVCEIIPEKNQKIKLAITTDSRTIKFESQYRVIEAADGSGG